ncbi:hypothetical protein GUJ93_ZPchr0583g7130 [Zizania palustris]|uniref:Leucine-rich repeat-containing N-terminal plant-type domain-containing protein n=1 Tax=Zizania palustris TaxID=103762 RepID=A0A8J5VFJ1_ZIZPA|nr:hypothetical protein GUJ93_ZPchr0583g7130 [Zizania palustris]
MPRPRRLASRSATAPHRLVPRAPTRTRLCRCLGSRPPVHANYRCHLAHRTHLMCTTGVWLKRDMDRTAPRTHDRALEAGVARLAAPTRGCAWRLRMAMAARGLRLAGCAMASVLVVAAERNILRDRNEHYVRRMKEEWAKRWSSSSSPASSTVSLRWTPSRSTPTSLSASSASSSSSTWTQSSYKVILHIDQLSGGITLEIGGAVALLKLLMRRNSLTGVIHPQIGNCRSLIALDLSENKLTGHIPVTIGNLISLQMVDVSQNKLNG